jgi:hypothetical protein
VLPSQIRTLLSCLVSFIASDVGGGANGQPGARVIGKSGMSVAAAAPVSVSVPVEMSVIEAPRLSSRLVPGG